MGGLVVEKSLQDNRSKAELMRELYLAYGREPQLHLPEEMITPKHETLIALREIFAESSREVAKYERVKDSILEGLPRMASEFGDDINAYKNTLRRIADAAKWFDTLSDGQRLEAFGLAVRNDRHFEGFVSKAASGDMASVVLKGLYGAGQPEFENHAKDVRPGGDFFAQAEALSKLKPDALESLGGMLTHALNSPHIGVKVRGVVLAQLVAMAEKFGDRVELYGKVLMEIEVAAPELEKKHDYEITAAVAGIVKNTA